MKEWWKSGTPWIWLTAASVTISIVVVVGLLALIAVRGLGHFWPTPIMEAQYLESNRQPVNLIGEIHEEVTVPAARIVGYSTTDKFVTRYLLKTGNRDLVGLDFRWILKPQLQEPRYPQDLVAIERREWGNFYGYLQGVKENGQMVSEGELAWPQAQQYLAQASEIYEKIDAIKKWDIGKINYALEQLRLQQRKLELNQVTDAVQQAEIAEEKLTLEAQFEVLGQQLTELYQQVNRYSVNIKVMDGRLIDIPLAKIVRMYQPNAMSLWEKIGFYGAKIKEFLMEEPREANTEGGIFPAIFGTIMMVIIMSVIITPFGIVAAVYLHEYAKQGLLTRTIRIAVNNLAGVPSIVYGVFGLGFFVYFIGGTIDQLFFPESLPAPTFGTGGIFWAALTLSLLTLPVVIVSTEEGLSRIPSSIREGSLALGATKAETLWRTVLPIASPAMMTGLILAIARAAGEVAPLMLVGVVKLAPSLAADTNYPFIHLERKFMHLGFHIYDVGFQSPNVEAARPLVYATSFLLVTVIIILNLTAIWIRNHLREKYKALETT
ncbi:MAG: phosphate ABC transporter, permease protein PstA [Beggiatoa sp. IS2]|nr:MAG: phosphate ABC transporter, permease protein PstA [Beggiatoa sp. IS2]